MQLRDWVAVQGLSEVTEAHRTSDLESFNVFCVGIFMMALLLTAILREQVHPVKESKAGWVSQGRNQWVTNW